MIFRALLVLSTLLTNSVPASANAAGEYAKHFAALSQLSLAVAQAMPADQYGFRPHPESMDFGQLMSHIVTTNHQFCAGLSDSNPPKLPSQTDKEAVVKFLSDSF
jgi:DinB superfamily